MPSHLLLASLLAGSAHADDRISTSRGKEGGLVVLWPRVVPALEDATLVGLASSVQEALVRVAKEAQPGAELDVRPSPQRVCPQAGCKGVALGAVLAHHSTKGCVVVVTVSPPGRSPAQLNAWVGDVGFKDSTVSFREPPESSIVVKDYADCDSVAAALATEDDAVVSLVKSAYRQGEAND